MRTGETYSDLAIRLGMSTRTVFAIDVTSGLQSRYGYITRSGAWLDLFRL